MTNYMKMNGIAFLLALVVALLLRGRGKVLRLLKISILTPLLGFPWMYFGISQRAWDHGDPGTLFFKVPIQELLLAFLMTVVSGGVFLLNYQAILNEASRRTKTEDSAAK